MTHFSIARLVGTGASSDPFRPPTVEEYSIIDLRPLSSQRAGKVDGWAIVATPERVSKGLGTYLGDNTTELSPAVAKVLTARFGITLDADPTLGELIGELLTVHATRPEDDSRWNPVGVQHIIRPEGPKYRLEAYLGNEVVWEREYPGITGSQQYTDDFNRSNASNLSSPWQVRDGGVLPIVSQKVVPSGSSGDLAVYLQPLSSDDHWAQIDMVSADVNFRGIDTQVRMQSSSSDLSGYGTGYIVGGGSYEIYKKATNGNQTTLFSQSGTQPQSSQIRTDIRGSTLKGTVSGTVRGQVTDTTITSGRYAGMFTYQAQSKITLDNFIASDFQATFLGTGSITPAGTATKLVNKSSGIAGTVSSSGTLTRMKSVFRQLTGTIASSGVLKRAFPKLFAGTVASSGAHRKVAAKNSSLAGTVGPTAKIKFMPMRRFVGALTVAGTPTMTFIGRIAGKAGYGVGTLIKAGNLRGFLRPGRRQ